MADDLAKTLPTDEGPGIALCTKCLAELAPIDNFCPRCRAPATSYANTAPFEGVLAEGWLMGESVVTRSPRLITLIGLWIIFLPVVAFAAMMLFVVPRPDDPWLALVGNLPVIAGAVLFGYCIYRGTRNYLRARRGSVADKGGTSGGGDGPKEGGASDVSTNG